MKTIRWIPLVALLGGCTIATPFRTVAEPAPETVIVVITHAVTGEDRARNRVFWRQVREVQASLPRQPGLVGYSIRRQLLGREAWTQTVWRDEASVRAFVQGAVHRQAMGEGSSALVSMAFARAERAAGQAPLPWAEAEALLAREAGRYGTSGPAESPPGSKSEAARGHLYR